MEMALVENIQREDLNAIEIALAYEHLLEKSAMTQEKVAERVGKSRPAIAGKVADMAQYDTTPAPSSLWTVRRSS